jgi:hypothetical protein
MFLTTLDVTPASQSLRGFKFLLPRSDTHTRFTMSRNDGQKRSWKESRAEKRMIKRERARYHDRPGRSGRALAGPEDSERKKESDSEIL